MEAPFGADLASYTLTPGRRTSYVHHPHIEIDRSVSPTSGSTFAPMPEGEEEGSSGSDSDEEPALAQVIFSEDQNTEEIGEIQFRTGARRADPQVRALYGQPSTPVRPSFAGGKLHLDTDVVHSSPVDRRESLVRPEEYFSPMPRVGSNFNPYTSDSWTHKPESDLAHEMELEGDISEGSDEKEDTPTHRQSRFESIALPDPAAQTAEADGTAVKSAAAGGRPLSYTTDWRNKLRVELSSPSKSPIKSPLYQAHLNSAASEKRGYLSEKVGSPYHFAKQSYDPAVIEFEAALTGNAKLVWFGSLTAALAQSLVVAYLSLRAVFLAQTAAIYPASSLAGAWIFFTVEVLYAISAGFSSVKAVVNRQRADRKALRIRGDAFLPTVDVLVICMGQHDQLVMDTAISAAKLDWPVDKLRVLVVDDSTSHELQRRVESHANSRALHLTYHRRSNRPMPQGTPRATRSTLINFGMTETRMHNRTPADFTLVLDADCIPDPDMLRSLVSHMVKNPKLGLVRCSQLFYNIPSPLSSSLGTFINAVEPIGDARSGFLMRRSAVDDVGGFPGNSSVEDGQLAALLEGKGFETKFVDETLQHGVAPDSFVVHLRQRMARSVASLRTASRMQYFVRGGLRLKQMGLFRRIGHLFAAIAPVANFGVLGALLLLPIAVFLNTFLVPVTNVEQLNILIRLLFAATLAERLHDFVFCLPSGTPGTSSFLTRFNFMAPYNSLALVRGALRGVPTVNAAFPLEHDERERAAMPSRRTPLLKRLGSVTFGAPGTLVHLAIAIALVAGLGFALGMNLAPLVSGIRSGQQSGLIALLTIAWPSVVLLWVSLLKAAMVPFAYAFSPPTVPSRDRLLVRDHITGIARPLPDCRRSRPFTEKEGWGILGSLIITAYVTVLFALTFNGRLDL